MLALRSPPLRMDTSWQPSSGSSTTCFTRSLRTHPQHDHPSFSVWPLSCPLWWCLMLVIAMDFQSISTMFQEMQVLYGSKANGPLEISFHHLFEPSCVPQSSCFSYPLPWPHSPCRWEQGSKHLHIPKPWIKSGIGCPIGNSSSSGFHLLTLNPIFYTHPSLTLFKIAHHPKLEMGHFDCSVLQFLKMSPTTCFSSAVRPRLL